MRGSTHGNDPTPTSACNSCAVGSAFLTSLFLCAACYGQFIRTRVQARGDCWWFGQAGRCFKLRKLAAGVAVCAVADLLCGVLLALISQKESLSVKSRMCVALPCCCCCTMQIAVGCACCLCVCVSIFHCFASSMYCRRAEAASASTHPLTHYYLGRTWTRLLVGPIYSRTASAGRTSGHGTGLSV